MIKNTRVLSRGRIYGDGKDIKFQINPTTMSFDGGAIWTDTNSPGLSSPIASYSYGKADTVSFELLINSRLGISKNNIKKMIDSFVDLRKSKKKVTFVYGNFVKNVVILDCPVNYQAWASFLNVTEALIPITLRVME